MHENKTGLSVGVGSASANLLHYVLVRVLSLVLALMTLSAHILAIRHEAVATSDLIHSGMSPKRCFVCSGYYRSISTYPSFPT
jgi:hypothetical protein